MGSWLEFGTLGGFVLGASTYTLLAGVLTPEQLISWGWRIPFLLAGPLGIIGLYIRLKLHETPVYQKQAKQRDEQEQQGFWTVFAQHWRAVLICIGLVLVFNVTDYMLLSYMPTFLTERRSLSYEHGLLLLIVVMLIMMLTITFGGRLSDRFGRRPILFAGCIGFLVLSWPAVQLIRAPSSWLVFAGLLLLGLTLVTFTSTMPATLPAMFPAGIRYGSVAIAYNVSASIFGGTVPLVSQSLISATGDDNVVAYYLMGAAAIGLVAVYFTKETAQQPMPESSPTITKEEQQEQEEQEDRKPEQRT
jgi:MHS family proline/betaine transporter-like MFS transporter